MDELSVTRVRSIAECGKNEFWLRDRIYDDPTILGLGNLQSVVKEKTQSQGGRLDLLLKNQDDDSMYEVELQLGPTDETHIVRTIEYWESEKRRWPRRSHTAVLIAETITNRFFNVIALLSEAVPIIGMQANIVEVGDAKGLHFTKIIDSYEEPEVVLPQLDERHWVERFPGALKCARWYRSRLEGLYGDIPIKYFESYLSLTVDGTARVWVSGRKRNDRAFIEVKPDSSKFDEVVETLNSWNLDYSTRDNRIVAFRVTEGDLAANATSHEWLTAQIAPSAIKRSPEPAQSVVVS
ncbi:MAG: hypothetical protein WD069_17695 [Planctomycetales bacterium]